MKHVAKKNIEKGSLSLAVKCFKYASGPISTPNARTNSRDPIVHSKPNFLGLAARTGKRKVQRVKQAVAPKRKQTKSTMLNCRNNGIYF